MVDCVTLGSNVPFPVLSAAEAAAAAPAHYHASLRAILGLAGVISTSLLGSLVPGQASCAPLSAVPLTVAASPSPSSFAPTPAASHGPANARFGDARSTPVSSANLLARPLRQGMEGEPVRRLQQGLSRWVPVQATGVFDHQTDTAVRTFQQQNKLTVNGTVDNMTYGTLWHRTFWEKGVALDLNGPEYYQMMPSHVTLQADLSTHRVQLVDADNGQVLKTYPISNGSKRYPTPRGTFTIGQVATKPTWHPPKSSWAKGAHVTPPGPNNPLGPAALRLAVENKDGKLEQSSILFHGVPRHEWSSIGVSAESHGCMRMFPHDAWELHKIVPVGTQVQVR